MATAFCENSKPLFLFLGQSYFGKNSNNGRILKPIEQNPTQMLDGEHRLYGAGHEPIQSSYEGFSPAIDFRERSQSPVTPLLYRYALRAPSAGLSPECVGHAESRSNASIEHLLPPEHEWHRSSAVFSNLMAAVTTAVQTASKEGQTVHVPALFFCQGTGDRAMDKTSYFQRVNALFDALADGIVSRTRQDSPPHFFVVQPPAKPAGGRWPCLQALNDLCDTRGDSTLALAGWALPQHDRTHFTGEACVALGEICAEVFLARLRGEDLSAPRIHRVRRRGRHISAEIAGAANVIEDAGPDTPRHRVGDSVLPNLGLDVDRGQISSVSANGKKLDILLAEGSEMPSSLFFAYATYDSLGRPPMPNKSNQSLNRGNIRADREIESLFLDKPLYQWLASSAHEIDVVG